MNQESLRVHFARLGPEQGPGADCPPPEHIFDAANGALDEEELVAVLDHTTGCAWCTFQWGLAVEIEREQAPSGEVIVEHRGGRRVGIWLGGAIALAAALLLFFRPAEPPSGAYRSVGSQAITASSSDSISLAQPTFSWDPIAGDAHYDVTVRDPDMTVLASAGGLDQPRFTLPDEVVAELSVGDRLVWTVRARVGDRDIRGSFVTTVR